MINKKEILNNKLLDFWAYLAGLIEADGYLRIADTKLKGIIIAGHKSQLNHFYLLATRVGMPFSIRLKEKNSLELTWTNPQSLKYIMSRLFGFLHFYNGTIVKNMFIKLSNAQAMDPNIMNKNARTSQTSYDSYLNAYLQRRLNEVTAQTKFNVVILSAIVGFIDGDGEMSIEIGAKHREKTTKNNISGTIKITQKCRETLQRIHSALLKVTPNPSLSESKGSNQQKIFKQISIYQSVSGSYVLRFSVEQTSQWLELVDSNCFKTPWNTLGSKLINVISQFKRVYNFQSIGLHIHKNTESRELVEWAKRRADLLTYMQLMRLYTRDFNSKGAPRLIARFQKSSHWRAKESNLRVNQNSDDAKSYFDFVENVIIINPIVLQKTGLKELRFNIMDYISHALKLINEHHDMLSLLKKDREKLGKQSSTYQTTYYPSETVARKSLRNVSKNSRLFKALLGFQRKAWYKTKEILK